MSNSFSKSHIITFMGPVGVGKSTQINLLEAYLKSKNMLVTKTFIKEGHFLTRILQWFLMFLGLSEEIKHEDGHSRIYPRRDILQKLFPLWCFLDSLSIVVKFFFTVFIPFSIGFTVLIEEGLSMTLHTYLVYFPQLFNTRPTVLPCLPFLTGWLANKNYVNVVLDATDQELTLRRIGRSFRRIELPEYVRSQKIWLVSFNADNNFIDTTKISAQAVHRRVMNIVENH